MRIAQIAPLAESCPPKLYGGTERIVHFLTEELVRQGHEVTLFASGDSQTAGELVPCVPRALRLVDGAQNLVPHHLSLVERVRRRLDDFDIVHFHIDQHIAGEELSVALAALAIAHLNNFFGGDKNVAKELVEPAAFYVLLKQPFYLLFKT